MKFYHCTDRIWPWPHQLHLPRSTNDVPVIPVLFANSTPLHLYGKNAYQFELEEAKILNMSHKVYAMMRDNTDYRAGCYDTARRGGYDALQRHQSEGDTTLAVLNFDKIVNWRLT